MNKIIAANYGPTDQAPQFMLWRHLSSREIKFKSRVK